MFMGSSGKMSTVCNQKTTSSRFSPQSHKQFEHAVADCLRLSPAGDCSKSVHGPIGDWDVSAVASMHKTFFYAIKFNADISKWDVSAVTDMSEMFYNADKFNANISRWDVSAITDMSVMFYEASSFNADISKWDVSAVTDMTDMFIQSASFDQVLRIGLFRVTGAPKSRWGRQQRTYACVYTHPLGALWCCLDQFKSTRQRCDV